MLVIYAAWRIFKWKNIKSAGSGPSSSAHSQAGLRKKSWKSDHGLLTNIILGVVGAGIGNTIFIWLGIITVAGWLGYLLAGFSRRMSMLIAASRIFKKNF
jgi:uncharacterized membrane protein YeaQ/YmgE (transglycosylase-associated protein family)